jgi:hypothetical protein
MSNTPKKAVNAKPAAKPKSKKAPSKRKIKKVLPEAASGVDLHLYRERMLNY